MRAESERRNRLHNACSSKLHPTPKTHKSSRAWSATPATRSFPTSERRRWSGRAARLQRIYSRDWDTSGEEGGGDTEPMGSDSGHALYYHHATAALAEESDYMHPSAHSIRDESWTSQSRWSCSCKTIRASGVEKREACTPTVLPAAKCTISKATDN
jgi:hypothetical protein